MFGTIAGMVWDRRVNEVGGAGRAEGGGRFAGDASAARVVGEVKDSCFSSSGLTDPVDPDALERRSYE